MAEVCVCFGLSLTTYGCIVDIPDRTGKRPKDSPVPETEPFQALLRVLERRGSGTAAACFLDGSDGAQLVAATPRFLARLAEASLPGTPGLDPPGLPPSRFGLDEAGLRIATLPGDSGWLVVATGARSRLPHSFDNDLADAAMIAGRLLRTRSEPQVPTPARRRADREAVTRWLAAVVTERRDRHHALLLLDLDRFRALNEALGTMVGDQVLAATGERIAAALGPGEQMLRLDGDRFAILAERTGSDPQALAQRLMHCVARPMEITGRSISLQASVGIADLLQADEPANHEVRRAEAALRRAKLEGRGRSVLHVPDFELADREEGSLEFDLAHAVADGQMRLAFQPYVTLATGRVAGAEALLRWRHPVHGELGPARFVPIAESTGAILPLGAWMMRNALACAMRWPDPMRLSVNISALQFHQPGFIGEVGSALAATGFPAHRLELEVTETVLMRDNADTVALLRALMSRGIRIALDDFGTGYSALAYLSRLPHHRIKLDRSFIRDLSNPSTAALIRAIVASARSQGVSVTAEGVETMAQLESVRAMGFTHAQGYATGAPMDDPTEAFCRALA